MKTNLGGLVKKLNIVLLKFVTSWTTNSNATLTLSLVCAAGK